jgi:flagellin
VIDKIDTALDTVNAERATLGATQSRFDSVISNLQVSVENQTSARSRIMDTDFAAETANLSRAQILQQAGNAMVAQANQLPQQVLKLLQG